MKAIVAILIVLVAAPLLAKEDPRLSHVRDVFVTAGDDLGDDKPIVACFIEHMPKTTPLIEVAEAEAPVIVTLRAHLPGDMARKTFGNLGTVSMRVAMKDGTLLWSGSDNLLASRSLSRLQAADIPCSLADAIADKLRQAMRKSRDGK